VHVLRATPLGRHLVHLVEVQRLRARAEVPLISVVSVGEVMSLGLQWNWGEKKLDDRAGDRRHQLRSDALEVCRN
jgi:hypothetical protein